MTSRGVGRPGAREIPSVGRAVRPTVGNHYEANRQRYIDQAAKVKRTLRRERTLYLIEYFKSHPCVDCGEVDPVVLEFDHLRDKSFAIGPEISRRAWKSILEEMEKCEVVCANCHRRRTARRRGAFRSVLTRK
jgi:5-methylcytosine-specific restriction endonuclease McrA